MVVKGTPCLIVGIVFTPIIRGKKRSGFDITEAGSKGLSPFDENEKTSFIIIFSTYISFRKDDLFHLWVIFENIPNLRVD